MQLFYNPDINSSITEFIFNKEEGRHIIRVLRKKEGDLLYITNGKGFLFKVQIIHANDKKCLVKIISFEEKEKNWNYHLHIAIAPTKMNDRFEWFLEKATEIGIDEITPIICDNSERKVLKTERMQKVLISAMKQSLKFELPKLNGAIKFSEFIQTNSADIKLIAHCEDPDKKNTIKNLVKPNKNILILIGPEGDFSTKEISFALQHQFIPLSLGSSRLRTETAGIVACSSISVINEK
ncbi:MAG: 16S rRNA (uracil(1498)-N(3))-methyltransferase [Bacteroidetes bacterium]|nr:MAG: 16S rRNA (uracil(1498)-N(3))-methyltransferase [Bacteroidota bacterium]